MALRIGFLTDPLETLKVEHDTTLALMREAYRRGLLVYAFVQADVFFDGQVRASMRRVQFEPGELSPPAAERAEIESLGVLDAVFLRKDPPVDVEFLHATQLVEMGVRPRALCVNRPAALRAANEKLFALSFPELSPPTLVSRRAEQLTAFVKRVGGAAVVKPLDGFGGKSVLLAREGDANLGSIIDVMTGGGQWSVVAQKYLPESQKGDKRILLLDGEPIGALLRLACTDDFRCNMAAGGSAERTELNARDQAICERIGPTLKEKGLAFVGIDVIGDFLIEVNVTSPTGLVEINRLNSVRLERNVIDYILQRLS